MRPQIMYRSSEFEHKAAAESASGQRALTITEALNRNRHLVITSELATVDSIGWGAW